MFNNRIGESFDTSLPVCRDRGADVRKGGGLVPVPRADVIHWPYETPDGIRWRRGQAQGPRPSTSSTPCPYNMAGPHTGLLISQSLCYVVQCSQGEKNHVRYDIAA